MIGLPLRLLAREVYDKVTARVGESRVALVTGEEQRIRAGPPTGSPPSRRCPSSTRSISRRRRGAVAAHVQRGHVFTSRLRSARGRQET